MSESLLPHFAAKVAEWFPELEGRSIPVSEIDVSRENMPRLPLAMVMLQRTDNDKDWIWTSGNAERAVYDDFILEFWLKPMKVRRQDNTETPFWAFYDYETFRDHLWNNVVGYVGPRGQKLEFRTMDIESSQYAVVLSFRFRAHFSWCRTDMDDPSDGAIFGQSQEGKPAAKIVQKVCAPKVQYCGPEFEPEDCDPCSSE